MTMAWTDVSEEEEPPEVPIEFCKTFFTLCFLMGGFVASCTSIAIIHDKVEQNNPLPDLFFDNLKRHDWALTASEGLVSFTTWTAFIMIISHRYR